MPDSDGIDKHLVTRKIIAGALITGVTVFLAIVLALRYSGSKPPLKASLDVSSPLVLAGLLFAAPALFVGPVIGAQMAAAARRGLSPKATPESQRQTLLLADQSRMIVTLALLEGAAFFNLVAVMVEGSVLNLIVAVLMLLAMGVSFPTRDRVQSRIESEMQEASAS